jgi:hypothetical protein
MSVDWHSKTVMKEFVLLDCSRAKIDSLHHASSGLQRFQQNEEGKQMDSKMTRSIRLAFSSMPLLNPFGLNRREQLKNNI